MALSVARFVGRATWTILALIGLAVVAIGTLSRGLGLYENEILVSKLSPDGKYVAEIVTSNQPFDIETLVTIEPSAGGRGGTVLTYEIPARVNIDIAWRDRDTLSISLPCMPPNSMRPAFTTDEDGQLRRIIVEAQPADTACRFARGVAPAAGFAAERS